jgi:hypothetical protein
LPEVCEHAVGWCAEWLTEARPLAAADLAAAFFPFTDLEALSLAADFLAWRLALDELLATPFGGEPPAVGALLAELGAVLDGRRGAVPLSRALSDLRRRLTALASPDDLGRVLAALRGQLEAIGWQAEVRATGGRFDPELFGHMRPLLGPAPLAVALIEPIEDIHLDDPVRDDPTVRTLGRLAADIMWQAGDLRSRLTVPAGQAFAGGVQRVNQSVRDYLMVEAQHLPSFGPEADRELALYRGVLRAMMAGCLGCRALSSGS